MAVDQERLQVLVEGRIRDFEKSMERVDRRIAKMEKSTKGAMGGVERASSRAARKMEQDFRKANQGVVGQFRQLGPALSRAMAFTGVGAGVLGGAGIVEGARRAIGNIRDLASEAERAGVAFEKFQELRFVARRENIGLDALVDGLKELQLRADEFVQNGSGPGAEAFRRLGFSAESLAQALREPDQLFLDIIERTREVESEAARLRIFDEIFGGTGGERLVSLLTRSREDLEAMRREARRTGQVLSQDVADDAEVLARKFDDLATTLETRFQGAVVAVAEAIGLIGARTEEEIAAAQKRLDNLKADPVWQQVFRLEDLAGRAGVTGLAGTRDETPDEAIPEEERIRRLRELVDRLTRQIERADEMIALAEADGAADRVRQLRDYAAELVEKLAAARRELAGFQGAGGAPPGIGPTGTPTPGGRGAGAAAAGVVPGVGGPGIGGLEDDFEAALRGFIKAAEEAGHEITVNSAFRSVERQRELWERAVRRYGSPEAARKWVAPPGRSMHNIGQAADLGYSSDAARAWAHANAGRFGMNFRMAHEPWHIEPIGGRPPPPVPQPPDRRKVVDEETAALRENTVAQEANRTARQAATAGGKAYAAQMQVLNDLHARGVLSLAEYNEAVAALSASSAAVVPATREMGGAMEDLQSAAASVGQAILGTLMSLVEGSENAEEALKRLAMQMAQMVLNAALFGQGPLGKLFGGGLLSAAFGGGGGGGVAAASAVPAVWAASGGYVSGPGTSTSDSIPARLSSGEYVVNAAATRRHRGLLEAINAGGTAPGFARGGLVGSVPRMPGIPKLEVRGGEAQARVVVNDQRRAGSPDIEQHRQTGTDGMEEIMLTIKDQLAQDIARGDTFSSTLEERYGLARRTR